MFIGHYAVGLASKRLAPRASLGALIAAPILLDLIWPVLLLLGVEHVTIAQNANPFLRLYFDSYPISHGLVAVVGWSTLYASLYFAFTRYTSGAIVIWIGVVSHWLLDYVVHRPDLPLYAGSRLYGLALWNHRWWTVGIEVAMLAFAVWVYLGETKAKNKMGVYGFWGFILLLLLAYAGAIFGSVPPSVKKLAIGTMAMWLFVLWAWWLDRQRLVTSDGG
jgi:hypothetical protein